MSNSDHYQYQLAQDRFGLKLAARLSDASDQLPYDISERLRAARTRALGMRKVAAAHASRKKRSRLVFAFAAALGVLVLGGALGAGFVLSRHFEAVKPVFAPPVSAAKEKPWENSLGMKFVPTAENLAQFLALEVSPRVLEDTGVKVTRIVVQETENCFAECVVE